MRVCSGGRCRGRGPLHALQAHDTHTSRHTTVVCVCGWAQAGGRAATHGRRGAACEDQLPATKNAKAKTERTQIRFFCVGGLARHTLHMGAHGTLDDALAGVAASRASPPPERRRRRSRSRSREREKKSSSHRHHHKSHKKDRKKHRDGGDDDKRRHRHRHRSSPPPPPLSPRAATSDFLAAFPEEAPSLRSLLAELDAGTGLAVDGVPSPAARSALTALLTALGARRDSNGAYELPAGAPRALAVVGGMLGGVEEEAAGVVVGPAGPPAPPPPLVGPSAPPPEVLAAAAAAAAASSDDDEVGPAAPADAAADADAATAEVSRVLAAIAASPARPDPYTVLGVPPSASPATVRAALRRGALLTHPDKNDAPRAAAAFAALAAAAAALRDPEGRASADAARAAAEEEAALKAFVAEERRKAEWRAVRGGGGPPPAPTTTTRESWMTELPSVAGPAAPVAGRSVNAFSTRGVAEVDRAWGVNPGDRPAALRGPAAAPAAPAPSAPSVDAVFNAEHRGESLLAQHARRAAAAPPPTAAAPDATHPWTPWDREAAMAPQGGRRSVVADPAKEAASLAGRFGKGGG